MRNETLRTRARLGFASVSLVGTAAATAIQPKARSELLCCVRPWGSSSSITVSDGAAYKCILDSDIARSFTLRTDSTRKPASREIVLFFSMCVGVCPRDEVYFYVSEKT